MKTLDLGQSIGILANLGVIAGIVFLGLELRQNNELLESDARRAVLDRRTNSQEIVATNAQLANVVAKSAAGEPLTDGEYVQLDAYNRRTLASLEWQFGEHQRGVIDLNLGAWRAAFHQADRPALRQTWVEWRKHAPADFVEFVEQNIVNQPPE